ncbi:MAG: tetratricopeptide repeat protein [Planctomycetota bacterium]
MQSLPLLIELLKSYIAVGDSDDAFEMSEWGLKLFPDSEAVRDIYSFSSRERNSERRKRPNDPLEPRVGPEPLLDLARAYLTAGKDDNAAQTLEKCIAQFPHCGRAHAELGEIYAQRFRTDLCSTDALEAIRHYEKAIAADADDVRAKFALAVLFLRIGAIARSREWLKEIVAQDRAHVVASSLLQVVARMEAGSDGDHIDSLLVRIEERGQLAHDYPPEEMVGKQARRQHSELVERLVESLQAEACAEEVVFVDHDRQMYGKQGPLIDICNELLPAAATAMRRMQLGALLSLVVETEQRQILLQQVPDGHIGMRTVPGVSVGKASLVLRRHLESYAGWRKT